MSRLTGHESREHAPAAAPSTPPIVVTTVTRRVSAQALVSFRGSTYSVPPTQVGQQVSVTHRLGAATLAITTTGGVTVAVHPRRTDGAGAVIRAEQHVTALNTAAPHRSKRRIPPGPAARQAADVLRGNHTSVQPPSVVDLTRYAEAAGPTPHPAHRPERLTAVFQMGHNGRGYQLPRPPGLRTTGGSVAVVDRQRGTRYSCGFDGIDDFGGSVAVFERGGDRVGEFAQG